MLLLVMVESCFAAVETKHGTLGVYELYKGGILAKIEGYGAPVKPLPAQNIHVTSYPFWQCPWEMGSV